MATAKETLRSALLSPLVGERCADILTEAVFKLDPRIVRSDCFSLFVSKGLGLGIVAGASIVKMPQIVKIFANKSAAGVSLLSYVLETTALAFALAYNLAKKNPFSTYGES